MRSFGVGDGAVDAVLRGAQAAGGLANPVLVQEGLADLEAAVHLAEHRVGGHPDVLQLDLAVVGRHVERPPVVRHREAGGVGRHQERGDAAGLAGLARGAGEDQVVGGAVHAGVEPLGAVDDPLVAVRLRRVVSSQVASDPWFGSVSPNAIDRSPVIIASIHSVFCASVPNRSIMMTCGKLPTIDDSSCRSLCSPSPLCARCSRMTAMSMLLPSRPPNCDGQAVAQPARLVGAPAHLAEQVLPLPPRDAAVLPVGAGVLAALVEVLHVLAFQRLDLGLDERVHLGEQARKVFGQGEIHGDLLSM